MTAKRHCRRQNRRGGAGDGAPAAAELRPGGRPALQGAAGGAVLAGGRHLVARPHH